MLAVLLAQAADQQQSSSPFGGWILLPLFALVFWFMIFRPQMKQQKEHQGFIDKLGKGDEVVTTGGIIGKVSLVAGDVVHIEVSRDVKLRVLKSQISQAYKPVEPKPAAADVKPSDDAKK